MNLRHPEACNALRQPPQRRARFFDMTEVRAVASLDVVGAMGGPEVGPPDAFDGRLIDGHAELIAHRSRSLGPARIVVGADGRHSTDRQAGQHPAVPRRRDEHDRGSARRRPRGRARRARLPRQPGRPLHGRVPPGRRTRCASTSCPGSRRSIGSAGRRVSTSSGARRASVACPFGEALADREARRSAGDVSAATTRGRSGRSPKASFSSATRRASTTRSSVRGFRSRSATARTVRDVLRGDDWSPAAFAPYAEERMERMRRLRDAAMFMSATFANDCDNRAERRARFFDMMQNEPLLLAMMMAAMGGPEVGPPEAFDGRLRADDARPG